MASQETGFLSLFLLTRAGSKRMISSFWGSFSNLLCQLRSKQVINLPCIRDVAFSEVGSDETVWLCNSYGYYYCSYCF